MDTEWMTAGPFGRGEICRSRLALMPFPNAFGELPRRGVWRQLLATVLKNPICSTSHTGG